MIPAMNPVFADGGDPNVPYIPPSHEVVVKDYTPPIIPPQKTSNLGYEGLIAAGIFGAIIFYVAYRIMTNEEGKWRT